jgi:hypothetical protein
MHANSSSWQHLPAPNETKPLGFQAVFTQAEAEKLKRGLIPVHMEDKWFIYFDGGWLRFHRSWTGAFIYALQLEDMDSAVRVVDSWVSRDPAAYMSDDLEYDRKVLCHLVNTLLSAR